MATSTIKFIHTNTRVRVNRNGNWVTADDNQIYLYKIGKVVFLSGNINNIVACPQYGYLFTLPDGYKPIHPFSLVPLNQTSNEWFFVDSDGKASPQSGAAATGIRYFSAVYMCV